MSSRSPIFTERRTRIWRRLGAWLGLALGSTSLPLSTHADAPPVLESEAALAYEILYVPEGGDIPITCRSNCAPESTAVIVEGSDGDSAVSGSIIRSGVDTAGNGWLLFRPDAPLVASEEQRLVRIGTPSTSAFLMVVVPAVDIPPSSFVVRSHFGSALEPVGEKLCCEGSWEPNHCFETREIVRPRWWMYVGSDSGAYSQWLYRVTLDIEDGESLVSELFVSRSDFNHTFDRAFTRLCYTLTAERWDGTEVSTVRTECIANPITYGEREITPDAWTSKYWSCDAPPDGHMDMWCRTHERCAMREPDDLYDLSCQDAIAICGWASSNDSGTSAEDAGPEVAAPDGSAANASAGSMCHAAPWRAQRSLEAWLAMGLLAWTSSRRRRLGATSRQASRCRSCS